MNLRITPTFLLILPLSLLLMTVQAQEHHKEHTPAEMNKQFQKHDLDVNEFIRRFETDSREIHTQRYKIVETIGLRPAMTVADIGAGTGLFSWLIAEKVGAKGKVYAMEIAPAFIKHINDQAKKRGLGKVVQTVLSTQETTNLAAGSIDVAFVCATYHHFEHPKRILSSIHQALRPGGQLVVIDFDLRKDSSYFVRERARAPKDVYFREIEEVCFGRVETKHSLNLNDNLFAAFRRKVSD
jgi:ubiquinone/menaquinone biosynthesis C-methylase UbiE